MLKRLKADESGLTLIEITIVIVILGLLASFIAPRVLNAPDKAKVAKAKTEIEALKNALEMYAISVGDYPTLEQGLQALWKAPNPAPENWDGPYISKPTFKDPWGNDYVYVYPSNHEGYDFDLLSLGKDGKEGGESFNEDITSWVEEETQ
jgi:general secretion pathway protein G